MDFHRVGVRGFLPSPGFRILYCSPLCKVTTPCFFLLEAIKTASFPLLLSRFTLEIFGWFASMVT